MPAEPASTPSIPATVRVLHLINGEHYSGAERVQDLLAARLPEFGFRVGFACMKPDRFPALRRTQEAPLYDAAMRGRFDVRPLANLRAIVRSEGYRILHAHTPRTLMVGRLLAKWTGVPLVYHVHSPASRDSTHRWRNRVNATLERISLCGAAGLIAVSESLGRHMRALGLAGDTISVVPNGVPVPADVPVRREPSGAWTLGTVALLRPRKGTEVLIDALALLRGQGREVRLRVVGPFETEDYQTRLLERVASHRLQDAVDWVGFTREVNAELARMDLFVLPSLFGEGLPMVVLEAMAAGVPVVGTWVEGVPEAVRDGVDGVLAQPGDAADLAAAIGRVVDGSLNWTALRRNARLRQAERFSDRSMAAGVAAVYQRILA